MKITVNNLDTRFTIDTYNTFTSDNYEEMEIENYNSEYKTVYNYDDFDFEYNNPAILNGLAEMSIDFIEQEAKKDNIIQSITVTGSRSPREYNFTTDSYTMDIECDIEKLIQFVSDNRTKFEQYCKEAITSYDGYMAFFEYDEAIKDNNFMMYFYLDTLYSDEYMDFMYENLHEIFIDTITMECNDMTTMSTVQFAK